MTEKLKNFISKWRNDFTFSTITGSTINLIINAAFIIFNGVIGIVFHTIWNGAICLYYIILAGIRGRIIFSKRHNSKKIYIQTHILLIIMNLAMIAPIALMINGDKEYTYGLIPAIAMTAPEDKNYNKATKKVKVYVYKTA